MGNGSGNPAWLLAVAALLALGAGGAYFWVYFGGLRGADLLEFATKFVALPLVVSLIMLFKYLKK